MKELVRTIHVNGDRGLSKRRHYLTTCISDVMLQTHRDVLVKIKLDNFHHQFIFSLTYSNQQCLNYKNQHFELFLSQGAGTLARALTHKYTKNFYAVNTLVLYDATFMHLMLLVYTAKGLFIPISHSQN